MERSSGVLQGGRDEGILDFDTYRVTGVDTVQGKGGGYTDTTDIHADRLTDKPTRLLEFHMLYGTNKLLVTHSC